MNSAHLGLLPKHNFKQWKLTFLITDVFIEKRKEGAGSSANTTKTAFLDEMKKLVISKYNLSNAYIFIMIIYMLNKVWIDRVSFGLLTYISMGITALLMLFFIIDLRNYYDYHLLLIFLLFSGFIVYECIYNTSSAHVAFRAIYEYIYYFFFVFCGIIVARTLSVDQLEKKYDKIVVYGAILPISTIVDVLTASGSGYRAFGIGRSEMALGVLLGIYLQILFFSNFKHSSFIKKFLIIFTIVSLICTGSRGPMVATFVASMVNIILHKRDKRNYLIKLVGISVVTFAFVYMFLFTNIHTGNANIDFYLMRIQSMTNWNDGAGNSTRLWRWNHYYLMFLDNFWIGIGPSKTGSWEIGATLGATESSLIRHLVELGIIGTVLYYLMVFRCLFTGIKGFKKGIKILSDMYILHFSIFVVVFIEHFVLQITEEITCTFFMLWSLGVVYGLATRTDGDSMLLKNSSKGSVFK